MVRSATGSPSQGGAPFEVVMLLFGSSPPPFVSKFPFKNTESIQPSALHAKNRCRSEWAWRSMRTSAGGGGFPFQVGVPVRRVAYTNFHHTWCYRDSIEMTKTPSS